MQEVSSPYRGLLQVLFFLLLAWFPFFLHLDTLPIQLWDESRLAHNAFNMYSEGKILVTYYEGSPDMWNTKPPLLIWMQVFFFKLIGPGELALRLPSAIAGLLTAAMMLMFSIRVLRSYWFGIVAVLLLICSQGFVDMHAARTGDYDALLTFFLCLYSISLYLFIKERKLIWLHLFVFGVALAVLTKSVQGLLFLPGLLFFIIYSRSVKTFFQNKWLYIDGVLALLLIASVYLGREALNPGYLQAVWENELGGRYLQTLEQHKHPFIYYYEIVLQRFSWYLLVPVGAIMGLLSRNELIKQITVFALLVALPYWLIISLSETKLAWYSVPLFPLLALIAAVPIYWVFMWLSESTVSEQFKHNVLPFLALFLLFADPYTRMIDRVYMPDFQEGKDVVRYLQSAFKGRVNLDGQCLLTSHADTDQSIYINFLQMQKHDVTICKPEQLKPGMIAFTEDPVLQTLVESEHPVEIMESFGRVKSYKILSR